MYLVNINYRDFIVIPSSVLDDKDLDWEEKGVLCYLLSKDKMQLKDIIDRKNIYTYSKAKGIIARLAQKGYIRYRVIKNDDDKIDYEYVISCYNEKHKGDDSLFYYEFMNIVCENIKNKAFKNIIANNIRLNSKDDFINMFKNYYREKYGNDYIVMQKDEFYSIDLLKKFDKKNIIDKIYKYFKNNYDFNKNRSIENFYTYFLNIN